MPAEAKVKTVAIKADAKTVDFIILLMMLLYLCGTDRLLYLTLSHFAISMRLN